MPTYLYHNKRTGETEERNVPIDQRDRVSADLERIIVVPKVRADFKAIDPCSPEAMVPKALRVMEQTRSAKDICKEVSYSRDALRRIWAFCFMVFALVSLSASASDVAAGYVFTPTDLVTSTKLNNASAGSINTSFYTGQSAVIVPQDADTLLLYSSAAAGFRRITFANLLSSNAVVVSNISAQVITNTLIISSQPLTNSAGTNGTFLMLSDAGVLTKITYGTILTNITTNINPVIAGMTNFVTSTGVKVYSNTATTATSKIDTNMNFDASGTITAGGVVQGASVSGLRFDSTALGTPQIIFLTNNTANNGSIYADSSGLYFRTNGVWKRCAIQ